MSKNPYFAHLPTWRNRQDLAYALDNLPKALELMTASSPLLATYSCLSPSSAPSSSPSPTPRTRSTTSSSSSSSPRPSPPTRTSSLPTPSMAFSPSSSSASLPFSAAYPSSSSISAPPTPQAGRSSPSFKERFMLDLTKELQRCQSPTSSRYHYHENDSNSYSRQRRDSGSSTSSHYLSGSNKQSPDQMQFMQAHRPQQHQHNNNINSQAPHTTNTQFHNNNTTTNSNSSTNPYYPLQFSTKAKAMAYLIEILQWLQKEPCGCDLTRGCYCGQDGVEDHVGKSPCYVCGEWYSDRRDSHTATTFETQEDHVHPLEPHAHQQQQQERQRNGRAWHEQGSLRHHVAESRVKKWLDAVWRPPLTPATSPEQENVRQFGKASPLTFASAAETLSRAPSSPRPMSDRTSEMDGETRFWTFHDIEMEARRKSRSRQNSTQRHQFGAFPDGYNQSCSPSIAAFVVNESSTTQAHSARTRTQSYSDPTPIPSEYHHLPPAPITSASFASSMSETATVSSSRSRAKKPIRASTTSACFVIPPEILDPSYRSPTFRIKSWTPPPSAPISSDMEAATMKLSLDDSNSGDEASVQKSGRLYVIEGQDPQEPPVPVVEAPAPAPLFQFNFTSQRFKDAVEASMMAKTIKTEEVPVPERTVQKTAECSDANSGSVGASTISLPEEVMSEASSHTQPSQEEDLTSMTKLTSPVDCVEGNEDASIASHYLTVAMNNESHNHRIQKSALISPMAPSTASSSVATATSPQSPVMATTAKSNWNSFQRLMVKMSKSDMALSRSAGIVQLEGA
ncbi:MAG: hypothetical protein BYD32DRAFT_491548 [Podila humilis]|nr:MAG: hypothetical protein BYD32DRAFT_491548 [Podila humilis]